MPSHCGFKNLTPFQSGSFCRCRCRLVSSGGKGLLCPTPEVLKKELSNAEFSHTQHTGQGETKRHSLSIAEITRRGLQLGEERLQFLHSGFLLAGIFLILKPINRRFLAGLEWKEWRICLSNLSVSVSLSLSLSISQHQSRTCCLVWTESETWNLFLVLPTDSLVTSVTSSHRASEFPSLKRTLEYSYN